MGSIAAILVAAGKSTRFADPFSKKPFVTLENRAVWLHSADRFLNHSRVKQTIIVIAPEDEEEFQRRFGPNVMVLGIDVCLGGETRADSVAAGLRAVQPEIDLVAIHDAARPCVTSALLDSVFESADRHGAAVLGCRVTSTLKRQQPGGGEQPESGDPMIETTVPRDGLWEAQTPQVFRRELILRAYQQAGAEAATDDSQLVERLGHPVALVQGSPLNIKLTTQADRKLAEQILRAVSPVKPPGVRRPFADDDDMFR